MEKSKDDSYKIVATLETELSDIKTKCAALERKLELETNAKEVNLMQCQFFCKFLLSLYLAELSYQSD